MKHEHSRGTRRILGLLALAMGAMLSGCASFPEADHAVAKTQDKIDHAQAQLSAMQPGVREIVSVHEGAFLGVRPTPENTSVPQALRRVVTLESAAPLTLTQAAAQIAQIATMPVHVAREVTAAIEVTGRTQGRAGPSTATGSAVRAALPGVPASENIISLPGVARTAGLVNVSWAGPLAGLLDTLAAQSGSYWSYSARDGVRFYLTRTRVYDVSALPGKVSIQASVSNSGTNGAASGGGSGGGNQGSTSQTTSMVTDLDTYTAIESNVKAVLNQNASAAGASAAVKPQVSVNPQSGQLVVTATPPQLAAVQRYVDALNAQMEQNVLIDVHVYAVSMNDSNEYNLNLQAALSNIARNLGPTKWVGPAGTSDAAAGQLTTSVVSGSVTANSVVQALAQAGHVSLVTSGSVLALNGEPTPMQVANEIGYVQSASVTTTANVGSSASLTPGQYTTGFSGNFLPLVRGSNILLQYSINLTQDLGLQTFSSGGSTIQLPQLATQAFQQRVNVRSGQTIVISGFEQTGAKSSRQGVGTPGFVGLGGNGDATNTRTALVVVMHVVKAGA